MKPFYLVLAILSILSNVPHTYTVVKYVTKVRPNKLAELQAWVFCGIISLAIMFSVFEGLWIVAIAGCIVEIAINSYYTYTQYDEEYRSLTAPSKLRAKRLRSIGSYGLGVIIPACIAVFSHLYTTTL